MSAELDRLLIAPAGTIDLDVTGMTCAACAARIERKLNKLDGVSAAVNYATEKVRVDFAATTLTADDLIAQIESTGYGAHLPSDDIEPPDRLAYLRRRLIVSVVLGIPVLLMSMTPASAIRWLAMGRARVGDPCGHLGGMAVPPRRWF